MFKRKKAYHLHCNLLLFFLNFIDLHIFVLLAC